VAEDDSGWSRPRVTKFKKLNQFWQIGNFSSEIYSVKFNR